MKNSVRSIWVVGVAAWLAASCGSGQSSNGPDAPVPDGTVQIDALDVDAAPDSTRIDAYVPDAYVPDAYVPDAYVPDAYIADATPPDATPPDAYIADASLPDAFVMPDAAVPLDAGPPPTTHLRLMAGNLTSGNGQSYQTPGIHIFKGVNPDVAMIQEFNVGGSSTSEIRTFIDQAFGTEYSYARGASSQQIPNGVVSRYPIIASGEWADSQVSNRQFVWAQIDIPGPVDLYAISVHLLTSGSGVRNTEAGLLKSHIQALPAGSYVVLGGDFNTDSRTEACISTLSSVLTTTGPFPVDQNNNGNTNANRNKPYDWVLVSSNLNALESPTVTGSRTFAHGLVADTRVYTPIADLSPAVASDSGASMMQHMGVARDFTVSGGTTTASVHVTSPNGGEAWTAGASQVITWTSSGVSNVKVELSTDGTNYATLAASVAAATGQLTITAPSTTTTSARVRVTAVPAGTPSDSSDAAFAISSGPPPVGHVFINEVLANEPNGDTTGEFVELVNSGTADQDISGWTISDSAQTRHVFASGTTLRAGKALVVFGGTAGIPAGLTNAVASSTGQLGLSNTADAVTLRSTTAQIDAMSWAAGQPDGESLNRSPDGDLTGTFVLHSTLASSLNSPGTRVTGSAF